MWNTLLESTESTNDDMRKAYEAGAPHGAWIRAKIQTKGRGRKDRKWVSDSGNLFFSYLVRSKKENEFNPKGQAPLLSWISLIAGILITETLQKKFLINTRLKWPNDLLLAQVPYPKVGGILCEGILSENEYGIVIGVGLNCQSKPEVIGREVGSLDLEKVDVFFESLLEAFQKELVVPRQDQIEKWKERFQQYSIFKSGDLLQWSSLGIDQKKQGKFLRLGDLGQLVLLDPEANEVELFSEEVSLLWER